MDVIGLLLDLSSRTKLGRLQKAFNITNNIA